jgi:hypothetical protein
MIKIIWLRRKGDLRLRIKKKKNLKKFEKIREKVKKQRKKDENKNFVLNK